MSPFLLPGASLAHRACRPGPGTVAAAAPGDEVSGATEHHGHASCTGGAVPPEECNDATLVLRLRITVLVPALAEDAATGSGRPGGGGADRVRRGAGLAQRRRPGGDSRQTRVHLQPGAVAGAAGRRAAGVPAGASIQSIAGAAPVRG